MRTVYNRARAKSPQLGALLNSGCDIIEVDEREVRIGFRFANHAAKASEKQNLDALRSIILELTERELNIVCQHEGSVSDWKLRESASRSPLVRAAQEMGARVIPSEPEEYR
jgi:hypothetical protein